jgi:hypothetical protein
VVPDAQRVGLRAVDDLQDARAAQQLRRGVNGSSENNERPNRYQPYSGRL